MFLTEDFNLRVRNAVQEVISSVTSKIISEAEWNPVTVFVNGEKKTFTKQKDYKDFLKARAAETGSNRVIRRGPGRPRKGEEVPKKKAEPKEHLYSHTTPSILADHINELIRDRAMKSIWSFAKNAGGVYGKNVSEPFFEMYKRKTGQNLFVKYMTLYSSIWQHVSNIETWGKKGEYATYEEAYRMSFDLSEISDVLMALANATQSLKGSKEMATFKRGTGNIVDGYSTVLGLKDLVIAQHPRKVSALAARLNELSSLLKEISDNGKSPFDYDSGKTMYKSGGRKIIRKDNWGH